MTSIEQTVEPKNGAIDFHLDIPQEWEGMKIKITLEPARENIAKPTNTGMNRFRGALKHLTTEQQEDMDQQLSDLRNEWERPTS